MSPPENLEQRAVQVCPVHEDQLVAVTSLQLCEGHLAQQAAAPAAKLESTHGEPAGLPRAERRQRAAAVWPGRQPSSDLNGPRGSLQNLNLVAGPPQRYCSRQPRDAAPDD